MDPSLSADSKWQENERLVYLSFLTHTIHPICPPSSLNFWVQFVGIRIPPMGSILNLALMVNLWSWFLLYCLFPYLLPSVSVEIFVSVPCFLLSFPWIGFTVSVINFVQRSTYITSLDAFWSGFFVLQSVFIVDLLFIFQLNSMLGDWWHPPISWRISIWVWSLLLVLFVFQSYSSCFRL